MNRFPTKSLSVGSTLSPISFDALVTISLAEIAIRINMLSNPKEVGRGV